jgi:hypothetical protein
MCIDGIFRTDFRVHSFQGKIPDPKKVQAIVNMIVPTNHSRFKSLMVWLSFIDVSSNYQVDEENETLYLNPHNVKKLGIISIKSTWKHQF